MTVRLLALVAGVLLFGQACAGPAEPVEVPEPTVTQTERIIGHVEAVQDEHGVWHDECAIYDRGTHSVLVCEDGFTADS